MKDSLWTFLVSELLWHQVALNGHQFLECPWVYSCGLMGLGRLVHRQSVTSFPNLLSTGVSCLLKADTTVPTFWAHLPILLQWIPYSLDPHTNYPSMLIQIETPRKGNLVRGLTKGEQCNQIPCAASLASPLSRQMTWPAESLMASRCRSIMWRYQYHTFVELIKEF